MEIKTLVEPEKAMKALLTIHRGNIARGDQIATDLVKTV